MRRKVILVLLAGCLLLCGCGSGQAVIMQRSPEETEMASESETSVEIPSYVNKNAFKDYIYINPYEADFQITDTTENIHEEYAVTPWCFASTEENIVVQAYLLSDKTIFVIQKADGEYIFEEARDIDYNYINNSRISIDCYDLTGDGNKELVITYPRYIGGSGEWCYTLFIMDLETNQKIPVFYDGETRSEFTAQQSAQINTYIGKWSMENTSDFTWWEPLHGGGQSKYGELDVFQPMPRHYSDGDAIVVSILRDPTHVDPVCIDVKLKYNNGVFEVDDMSVTSWRKYTG